MSALRIVEFVSGWYAAFWTVTAAIGKWWPAAALARAIQAEMRPLYLLAVVAYHATNSWLHGDPFSASRLLSTSCGVANYWIFKNDDDDRWRRRRRKLAERIQQQGARLVVVTEPAS